MKTLASNHWKEAVFVLLVVTLSPLYTQRSYAQSSGEQNAQLQQVQNKLELMEKEMQELKQQISIMQHPQGPSPDLTIGGAVRQSKHALFQNRIAAIPRRG